MKKKKKFITIALSALVLATFVFFLCTLIIPIRGFEIIAGVLLASSLTSLIMIFMLNNNDDSD